MNLSPNFTLEEFVRSQYAARNGISNTPNEEVIKNLHRVAYTLEIIRNELNAPVIISSGYRCPELNLGIGGSKRSKHMQGLAVDFTVKGYTPAQVVERVRGMVGYDKLILEFDRWVHLGLSSNLGHQVLVAKSVNGSTKYEVLK
jgi:zinc D-Ala-D-Ala carboxypeptidase